VAGFAARPQSLNPYAYAEDNPANWTDPSGNVVVARAAGCVVVGPLCVTAGQLLIASAVGFGATLLAAGASILLQDDAKPPPPTKPGRIQVRDLDPIDSPAPTAPRPALERLTDDELLDAVSRPRTKHPITINTKTGKVYDGNGRAIELKRRAADPNGKITQDTEVPFDVYTPDDSMFWDK
jgi:hypothetical protein